MVSDSMIEGFSRLSREEKIRIAAEHAAEPADFTREITSHWHPELKSQVNYDIFSENTISNFYLPYSLAPNFLIDGKNYIIPMVTEESSVVAAASAAAKFWWSRGGFRTKIKGVLKPGHIHFLWKGGHSVISGFIGEIIPGLLESVSVIEKSMKARDGGVVSIRLKDKTDRLQNYYQLEVLFNTVDAMGANFINTCLEAMAQHMIMQAEIKELGSDLEIIMAVLSNYTPHCIVECEVSCPVQDDEITGNDGGELFRRMEKAVLIAGCDVSRAVTQNKGIYNGVDAVIIATGNDFRAVEAAGHAWASRDGYYKGLSTATIHDDRFKLKIEMPIPVGVVGGMTNLHPLAKASLQLLGNPKSETLMSVAAAAGLANHFSAIKSLVSGGIQQGHMKLHLVNILKQLKADQKETEEAVLYFKDRSITLHEVRNFISLLRGQ